MTYQEVHKNENKVNLLCPSCLKIHGGQPQKAAPKVAPMFGYFRIPRLRPKLAIARILLLLLIANDRPDLGHIGLIFFDITDQIALEAWCYSG
ncbi:hypothetical protein PFICI_12486 [Pestalotiopsis fici W106-1]|uniref:Uncharacterized protein n=1 Tax=Pestalotiopsis fici (strain W106-1 / CGMCC3.15140) TaxID=1229662 RepID=W3WQV0_PESFW|nr:uncharacterized protein PFICI_12486 [Pestalotiopsis fici W106-1]ETS75542.1 hypothetical protein PFICI_12486 [Pestalotiopsis fici W106-1]